MAASTSWHGASERASTSARCWKPTDSRPVRSRTPAGPHAEAGAFGTIGRPVDCEARLAANGELQLRGDNVFAGYWRNPERTAETFTADGWMRTGDLARARSDGSYEILGRLKTVVMSGGFLIRPEEIDEVMLRHPRVVQSVTVAMPDAASDEVPMTAVLLDGEADEAALTAHARERLEPLKVPKRIVAMDAIPRGDAGKPRFEAVRREIAARLAASSEGGGDAGRDVEDEVLATAAEMFRVDRAALSPRTTPDIVPGFLYLDVQNGR